MRYSVIHWQNVTIRRTKGNQAVRKSGAGGMAALVESNRELIGGVPVNAVVCRVNHLIRLASVRDL